MNNPCATRAASFATHLHSMPSSNASFATHLHSMPSSNVSNTCGRLRRKLGIVDSASSAVPGGGKECTRWGRDKLNMGKSLLKSSHEWSRSSDRDVVLTMTVGRVGGELEGVHDLSLYLPRHQLQPSRSVMARDFWQQRELRWLHPYCIRKPEETVLRTR